MSISEQVKRIRDLAADLWIDTPIVYRLKDELRKAADTIESLSTKLKEADCGSRRIPCEDKLPEDGVDVFVWFEYFRYGEYNRLFQTKGISYTHNGQWSGFVNGQSGWNQLRIIAWRPMPEALP